MCLISCPQTRSQLSLVEVWSIALQDQLLVLPVPLQPPDANATLDLGLALRAVYNEAVNNLLIDHEQVLPPPALSEAELVWGQAVVSQPN